MAIDTSSTAGQPYFDDYTASGNSDKNYLKVLFQAGRSVQVRELNQMQSAIQDQIDKFGQHIFVDGTRVLEGEIDVDNKVQWVDITLSSGGASAAANANRPLIGKRIYVGTALASATVSATIMDYELVSGDKYRFYVRYDSQTTAFENGTRIQTDIKISTQLQDSGEIFLSVNGVLGDGTDIVKSGFAIKLHNNKGVYFIKGYFVIANAQTKYIDVDQSTPYTLLDGKVGFLVNESTVSAVNDNTLYDNAAGTTNQSAPGADRFTMSLTLCLITDDTQIISTPAHVVGTSTANAIDVITLNQAQVTQPVQTKYNKLGETLATRTFEESGDYALQPFQLELREHLNTGFNRGKYAAGAVPAGNGAKFIAALEPSTAYVKGKRIEIIKKQEIIVDKARDTEVHTSEFIQARQGNYIELTSIANLPKCDANASSPTSYTLSATSGGSSLGTCTIRGIEYTGRRFRLYISAVTMGANKLSAAKFIFGTAADGTSTFTGTNGFAGGFQLNDISSGDLVFPLPQNVVKSLTQVPSSSLNTIKIPIRETSTTRTVAVSGSVATIALPQLSGSQYYQDNPNDYIVVNASGAFKQVSNVSITNSAQDCTLTLASGHGFANAAAAKATYSFKRTATLKTKTKTFISGEVISTSTYTRGQTANLVKTDVIGIDTIVGSVDGDLADSFILVNGQTPTNYGVGQLKCTKAVTTTQTLTVAYRYLEHAQTGNDAFWVDSYTIGDDVSAGDATNVQRAEVSHFSGRHLLDMIDFRGSNVSIDPNGIIEFGNIEFFIPRHDRIVLKTNGEFEYLEGDTEANGPQSIPDNAMLLYDLDVPAYTNSVQGIEIGYHDNRRYTMKDIGKIDRRVKNLEYYSSLSLLEQITKDQKVLDDDTIIDRFKHGIMVDEFKGHAIGMPSDPGYRISIEPEKGILRPSFRTTNIGITLGTPGAGNKADDKLKTTGGIVDDPSPIGQEDIIRLNSSSIGTLIDQPFASVAISVNPFDVASWVGEVKLSPDNDEWRDTNRRPEVIISQDGNSEAILNLVNEQLASEGTRWNDWNTTWSGVTETRSLGWNNMTSTANIMRQHGGTTHTRNCRCGHRNTLEVPTFNGGTVTAVNQRRAQIELEARTTSTIQTRDGMQQFAELETIRESLGDKVVDVSFVPFIRSRRVYFRATGLKPNTTIYPFFDGVDVSGYVKSTAFVEFRDDSTRQDHTNDSPGDISADTLVSNDAGTLTGYLVIPNNDALRFRTGEREVIFSDDSNNDLTAATTYAKATYAARGLLQTVEEQVLTTRRVAIDERRVESNRTLTTTQVAATGRIRHVDPLAQTFLIDGDLYPAGITLKDIDLYFAKSHSKLPVSIHLVPTENGIPTQKMIPFSRVERYPNAQAAVDAGASATLAAAAAVGTKTIAEVDPTNASLATKFVFDSPVHLKGGSEYAIVVMSNSPDWTLWHSEVGGIDVGAGSQRITKNPYTGVSLKSANASTWTPDQNKDFKMKINYMQFFESGSSVTKTSTTCGYSSFTKIFPAGTTSGNPVKCDAINLNAGNSVELPGTSISYSLTVAGETYSISPGRVLNLHSTVDLYANRLALTATLKSNNKYVTPQLDVQRLSLLSIKNNIDNDLTNETRETHGNADARYITKPVVLDNSADRLDVYMDIKRPLPQCNVDVYARFDDITGSSAYVKLESATIPVSGNFREVHFRTSTSDDINLFTKFQIKIILRSVASDGTTADSAIVPEIKNFRAIATQ